MYCLSLLTFIIPI